MSWTCLGPPRNTPKICTSTEIQVEWGNAPSRAYFEWHRDRPTSGFALGAVQFVQVSRLVEVANMICQQGFLQASLVTT
eukprot:5642171-Amphidinium_carterae.1